MRDKARQIELYGQRYRDVVSGVARAFEIAGGIRLLTDAGYDARLQRTLQDDPNLIALAICPVKGEVHRAFQPDLIKREEVDQRVGDVLGAHEWTRSHHRPAADHSLRTGDGVNHCGARDEW